jgi:hypothetical protein
MDAIMMATAPSICCQKERPSVILDALAVETSDPDYGIDRREERQAEEYGLADLCGQCEERISEDNPGNGDDLALRVFMQLEAGLLRERLNKTYSIDRKVC